MAWFVPFNRLDLKQIEAIDGITRDVDRPHWVRGFAGTGKTLILTQAIERVAADHPDATLCYITFTHALKDMVLTGLHGPVTERVKVMTHASFLSRPRHYDYVFLDEVQDIAPLALKRIRDLAGSVIVAGDPEQSIYDEGASEEQITATLEPQHWQLVQIHRLTDLLRRVAQAVLPSSRIVEGRVDRGSAEVTIRMGGFDTGHSEARWVWEQAVARATPGEPCAILFPSHEAIAGFARHLAEILDDSVPESVPSEKRYATFNEHWKRAGVPLQYLGNGHGSLAETETRAMVCFMTFHSSKGLDFDNVFIPGMNDEAKIVADFVRTKDPVSERRLLFVAVTRSRKNLFITHSGANPHRLLENIPAETRVDIDAKRMAGCHSNKRRFGEQVYSVQQENLEDFF